MCISKADKGFTLIEVMVSLGIFAMLFSGALAVMLSEASLAAWNRSTRDNIVFTEAVAGLMADGMTYSEVLELRDAGRIYITGEDIEMDFLKERGAYDMFTGTEPAAGCHVSLHITEGTVLEVEVRLHQTIRGKADVYSSKFWKGSYKR